MELKDIKKLMDEIVESSFPLLRRRKIVVKEFKKGKYGGGVLRLPFLDIVFVNKKVKSDKKRVIGLLSHELSHLERFEKKGWIKYFVGGILYWISPKYRIKDDRETDKLVIRKGYGRELHHAAKKARKNPKRKNIAKYYLSAEEIKTYAKKIGKW